MLFTTRQSDGGWGGGGQGLVGSVYGQFGNGRQIARMLSLETTPHPARSPRRQPHKPARRTTHGLQLNVCFITRISAIRNWFREYFAQREEKLRLFLTRRKRRSFLTKEVGGLHF